MDATEIVIAIGGGVALLLWGVRMVRTGITRAYGADLRQAIAKLARTRLGAFAGGFLTTLLVQSSTATALILIRNDKLQLIDTVFTFNDRFCGFDRDETPEFHAGDRDGRTYSDIVATVTEVTKATDESCEGENPPKPGKRTFTVTYRWDETASAFKPDSDAFDVLAKENEERF